MVCRSICLKYQVKGDYNKDGGSRCQHCGRKNGIYINWLGLWCPCCGYRLRKTARNKHGKETMKKVNRTRMN